MSSEKLNAHRSPLHRLLFRASRGRPRRLPRRFGHDAREFRPLGLSNSGKTEILKQSTTVADDPELAKYFTRVEAVEFPTEGEPDGVRTLLSGVQSGLCGRPRATSRRLLVKCHGGPTAAASSTLNLRIQYWTSRGIAVLDVNYGGSTGFGREYRERLDSNWGIVDVDDCVNGARFLAEQGLVDGNRSVITGGSAGGYTTLAALTFRDYFRGGASHYGVSDLAALVARHP